MLGNLLIVAALQIGPFYEERPDYAAVRPFWSHEQETTDVLWPIFTAHRDWWRFCWFVHYQEDLADSYQFEVMPLWFNGQTRTGEDYWGLFPIYGHHPHLLLMYDVDFCLWPIWHRYRMPRRLKSGEEMTWMTSNAVLFPFFTWRDDGAWGFWPFCGVNHARESTHRYALWPLVTWADYRADRDTGGEGTSWMFWPLVGRVEREREIQTLFLPPLFSCAETPQTWRLRCPWPVVEVERGSDRDRTVVFPLYEHEVTKAYSDRVPRCSVTRFGWRIVEIYRDDRGNLEETRVFPFWKKNARHTRVWPFWESYSDGTQTWNGALALFPITWADSVDRNWSKFWTFYESLTTPTGTEHSLLWGIIRWRTSNE